MTAYYNEHDPYAAAWLRNLITAGHIAAGNVDDRDIRSVQADDLRQYTQCHFFAGIGGWSLALRLAGWPDERPVWTGSCPCQPFSAAGKRGGTADERHLWPEFFRLIRECRPATVFGEQVASKDGLAWFDVVSSDLESAAYAVGAADLCAAGVGAPHIRQRLWFVATRHMADAAEQGRGAFAQRTAREDGRPTAESGRLRDARQLADGLGAGLEGRDARSLGDECAPAQRGGAVGELEHATGDGREQRRAEPSGRGAAGGCSPSGVADADGGNASAERQQRGGEQRQQPQDGRTGPWHPVDWLPCRDGKARPVEPGTFPLAHGVPGRVGKLRAYGNAIVPQVAAEVIGAFMECRP